MKRATIVVLALIAGAIASPSPGSAVQGETTLVSRVGEFGPGGADDSGTPRISADGSFVVFDSDANNLATNDNDGVFNVYRKDLRTGIVTLVSLPNGTDGTLNLEGSTGADVSADGRYVAFRSDADNLTTDDNNAVSNVYVRDVDQQATYLVSRPTGANGAANNNHSDEPRISSDGRFVVFHSLSDNMTTVDNDTFENVYVHDLQLGTTTLVSQPTGANGTGNNGHSGQFASAISGDGRYVAFDSDADNMSATEDNNAFPNVFLRDLQLGTTTLVNRPTGGDGTGATSGAFTPTISSDGRFVSFDSDSNDLSTEDNDAMYNVYVRDTLTGTTTLASRPTGGNGLANNNFSFNRGVSTDGRYVAFDSESDNMSTTDNDLFQHVYVHDMLTNTTTLVDHPTGSDASGNDGGSGQGTMSRDGRVIAFSSVANNLSPDDSAATFDVFVHDILGPQPPTLLSIGDVSKKEGKSGTTSFVFAVSLTGPNALVPITVDFSTSDASALQPSDYALRNGTLRFEIGQRTKTITVPVVGDNRKERNETFLVSLFNPDGAAISDGTATGTIKKDEKKKRRR